MRRSPGSRPWLAQMGYEGRAGTYSYDLFERSTGRNLHRIDPDLPPLAAGDTMPFYPGAPMTVAVADPRHALVLWQVTVGGKAIDPAGPWGDNHVVWSWAFVLEPVDAATTRLLVRMRVATGRRPSGRRTCGCWWSRPTSSWAAASSSVFASEPNLPAPLERVPHPADSALMWTGKTAASPSVGGPAGHSHSHSTRPYCNQLDRTGRNVGPT